MWREGKGRKKRKAEEQWINWEEDVWREEGKYELWGSERKRGKGTTGWKEKKLRVGKMEE